MIFNYIKTKYGDESKLLLTDTVKTKYGDEAKLLLTDTDSLAYEIRTKDFCKYINPDVEKQFDTSDYPINHPSGIKTGLNSKVLGLFKDEAGGKPVVEFVG